MSVVGHEAGVRLWGMMSSSCDPEEQRYFSRLVTSTQLYGKVWFTDVITQRQEKCNQTTWAMEWDVANHNWVISLFLVPSGAREISDRLLPEIDLDDIKIDE